jgi:hypothetical protein
MSVIRQAKNKISKKSLIVAFFGLVLGSGVVYAATTPQLNQTISDGAKSVDIVDAGGVPVASPSATFGALSFSFNTQDATASNIFTSAQRIRVSNPTSTATWSVNIAGSAPTAVWTAGGNTYDFNDTSGYTDGADTDTKGGQLTVDPSAGTIAGVSGCATTNVTAGTSDSFVEGTTNSIDLFSGAAGASTYCRWDFTGANMTQKIPAGQPSGSYSVALTVTIT